MRVEPQLGSKRHRENFLFCILAQNLEAQCLDGDHGDFDVVEGVMGVCFVTGRNPGPQSSSEIPKGREQSHWGSLDLSHGIYVRPP